MPNWKFKKTRGARACEVCRFRKVRCDAADHYPCTSCVTFGCECKFPEIMKRRRRQKTAMCSPDAFAPPLDSAKPPYTKPPPAAYFPVPASVPNVPPTVTTSLPNVPASLPNVPTPVHNAVPHIVPPVPYSSFNYGYNSTPDSPGSSNLDYVRGQPVKNISSVNITPHIDPYNAHIPSNGLRVKKDDVSDFFFYGYPSAYAYFSEGLNYGNHFSYEYGDPPPLDPVELDAQLQIWALQGVFLLPSRQLCWTLIDAYFEKVYPFAPILDKGAFLRHFGDPDPNMRPPLVLLMAVLVSGSVASKHPAVLGPDGTTKIAEKTFAARIKALLNCTYKFPYVGNSDSTVHDDGHMAFSYPTVVMQTYMILSVVYDGPDNVLSGPYYKVHRALSLAVSNGLNTDLQVGRVGVIFKKKWSQKLDRLGADDTTKTKALEDYDAAFLRHCFVWRKLWWFIIVRAKNLSSVFGRGSFFDLRECSTKPLTLQDFSRYEDGWSMDKDADLLHANYFIHLVRVCEIVGDLVKSQYTVIDHNHNDNDESSLKQTVRHYNVLLGLFYNQLPDPLKFRSNDASSTNTFSCIINCIYYWGVYHVNRLRLAKVSSSKYWGVCFQSIYMMSQIALKLEVWEDRSSNPMSTCLGSMISMAVIVQHYHMSSSNPVVAQTAQKSVQACVTLLSTYDSDWMWNLPVYGSIFHSLYKPPGPKWVMDLQHNILRAMFKERANKGSNSDISFLLNDDDDRPGDIVISEDEYKASDKPFARNINTPMPPLADDFFRQFDLTQLFANSPKAMQKWMHSSKSPPRSFVPDGDVRVAPTGAPSTPFTKGPGFDPSTTHFSHEATRSSSGSSSASFGPNTSFAPNPGGRFVHDYRATNDSSLPQESPSGHTSQPTPVSFPVQHRPSVNSLQPQAQATPLAPFPQIQPGFESQAHISDSNVPVPPQIPYSPSSNKQYPFGADSNYDKYFLDIKNGFD